MKRFTTILLLAVVTSAAIAQEGMMQPVPEEIGKVAFLLGDWECNDLTFNFGTLSKGKGTISSKMTLNGRYVTSNNTYSMTGMPGAMEGLHVMNYEPAKKAFVAFWFDGSAPGAMEMSGNIEGDILTMVSKPTAMEGMGEIVMRSSWTKKSDKEVFFKLEMKQGEKWAPMLEGTYTKKS